MTVAIRSFALDGKALALEGAGLLFIGDGTWSLAVTLRSDLLLPDGDEPLLMVARTAAGRTYEGFVLITGTSTAGPATFLGTGLLVQR